MLSVEIEELHRVACSRQEETYLDPASGLTVFTEFAHSKRGACCGSGCRHCPYRNKKVAAKPKKTILSRLWLFMQGLWQSLLLWLFPPPPQVPPREGVRKKSGVYTRAGDKGRTRLLTGDAVAKDSAACEAMGEVDELSVKIGMATFCLRESPYRDGKFLWLESTLDRLDNTQVSLLDAGAILAAAFATKDDSRQLGKALSAFDDENLESLELELDRLDASLPPLSHFVLPRGDRATLDLHDARVVCRRAERRVWRLIAEIENPTVIDRTTKVAIFLNRLSDFLFVAARAAAHDPPTTFWRHALSTRLFFFHRRTDYNQELSYDVKRARLLSSSRNAHKTKAT